MMLRKPVLLTALVNTAILCMPCLAATGDAPAASADVVAPDTSPTPDQYPAQYDRALSAPEMALRNTGAFFERYVELGLALNIYSQVEDSDSDGYLGTIDGLDLKTGPISINSLRLQLLLPKDFRLELGWSDFEFETRTGEGDTDGSFTLNGPRLLAIYRPNCHNYIKPVVAVGVAMLDGNFDADSAFYYGFSGDNKQDNYRAWRAGGSQPNPPNGGYHKDIRTEDTWAWHLRLGVDVTCVENWVFGADYEYIDQSITGDYVLWFESPAGNHNQPFRRISDVEFPAELHVFSIYARYSF